jgi:hypothetical protein
MKYIQEPTRVEYYVPNASKAINASFPDLVIKPRSPTPVSDRTVTGTANATNSLFRTLIENGQEVIDMLDSDHEMELVDASKDKAPICKTGSYYGRLQ